jgi:DNA-binding NtrC family response regulator
MALIADRFLIDEDDAVDLATGEGVRLSIEPGSAGSRERAAACDRLIGVRHPLLFPLLDYGTFGDRWFEAHAAQSALQVSSGHARAAALHLVRFLRSAGVELTADIAARNVRPAIDGAQEDWRPLGVFVQGRPSLDAVRAVIESAGPPGVTAISVHAPHGSGLRTARLQIARAARLAGFVVIDSRFSVLEEAMTPARHLCVLDWLTPEPVLPAALTLAAAMGARRHAWIRFSRRPMAGAGTIGLEPLMTRELMAAIYMDDKFGPTAAEVRCAIAAGHGSPGATIGALSARGRSRRGLSWVHETAPAYNFRPAASSAGKTLPAPAGVSRLERAVEAARTIAARGRHARAARLLARCSGALAVRGSLQAAAQAACLLGELHIDRGRLPAAAAAFLQAQKWLDGPVAIRALIGSGRVLLEQGRVDDAEAAFRTAALADARDVDPLRTEARRWLAETLMLRGRFDAAEELLGRDDAARLSVIKRLKGDLPGAAQAAARALASAADLDARDASRAYLAAAHAHAALGDRDGVHRHAAAARRAARDARIPALRLVAEAETLACLELCGVAPAAAARDRLLRAAAKLPRLAAARIRTALHAGDAADAALIAAPRDNAELIHRFQALLNAIHDAPDETTALQLIAADLLAALDACSVVLRSVRLGRRAAEAGRAWPAEEALARAVLDGGCHVFRTGVTPEAAEAVTAAGSVLGSIAVRWVAGANPPLARVRDVLRTAAAAAAPMMRALTVAPAATAAEQYPDDMLGRGAAAERVRDVIRRAALAPYPVLIEGESGSGKELVARAIHARGNRRARKFCAVNCAALTDDLLEAELFGHARGAFTGAVAERAGLFEEADQGTIFLDEAGELTPRAQAKLLRVIQEGEIRRVGENTPRKVDARLVAATNRSLEADVRAGRFRADLRFRIDVIRIPIPPLRERPDDVPWLVERLWADAAARVGTRATLGDDVVAALARFDWPGNVRELQNVIASLAVHGPRRGRIHASLLPARIAGEAARSVTGLDEARLDFERRYIRAALARAGGRRNDAASQLGMSRQGLGKIIKRLGIIES